MGYTGWGFRGGIAGPLPQTVKTEDSISSPRFRKTQGATMASYDGLSARELMALSKQRRKNVKGFKCELGHDGCGCTTEPSQDGKAPCFIEVEKEIVWRGGWLETVG